MRIYESVQIIEARFRYTKDVQVVYEEWINDLFLKSFDGELKFQSGLLRKIKSILIDLVATVLTACVVF